MNGNKVLLDSNLVIYLAKGLIDFDAVIIDEYEYYISVITYMEILGFSFKSKNEEKNTKELIDQFKLVHIDNAVIQKVISLRKKNNVKLPDAIICATAMENRMTLYSNDKRLSKIDKIDIRVIGII
jgi:predicted nucleic acid-binding protein